MNIFRKSKKLKPVLLKISFAIILVLLIYGIVDSVLRSNRDSIEIFIESSGIWGPVIIFLARSISIIFPALPSSIFSLIAGGALGFKVGYSTIVLSDLICCQLAFFIARNYGKVPVKKIVGAKSMKKIESFNQNQLEENFFLMTGLLMTGLFDFLSYSIGLGGTRWRTFTPALIISLLVSDSVLVAVGAQLGKKGELIKYTVIPLLVLFGLAILIGIKKTKSKKRLPRN